VAEQSEAVGDVLSRLLRTPEVDPHENVGLLVGRFPLFQQLGDAALRVRGLQERAMPLIADALVDDGR
jgi:hypothetical protein